MKTLRKSLGKMEKPQKPMRAHIECVWSAGAASGSAGRPTCTVDGRVRRGEQLKSEQLKVEQLEQVNEQLKVEQLKNEQLDQLAEQLNIDHIKVEQL